MHQFDLVSHSLLRSGYQGTSLIIAYHCSVYFMELIVVEVAHRRY